MRSVDRKLKVQCRCDWKEPKAEREVNKTQRPPSLAGRCRRTSLARFLKATRHQSKVVHFVKTHDFSPIQLPFRDPPRLYIKPLFLILLSGVALSPCEGSPVAGYFQASQPVDMPTASRAKLEWLYRDLPLMITGVSITPSLVSNGSGTDVREGTVHVPPPSIHDKQD